MLFTRLTIASFHLLSLRLTLLLLVHEQVVLLFQKRASNVMVGRRKSMVLILCKTYPKVYL